MGTYDRNVYHALKFERVDGEIRPAIDTGTLTEEEQRYSRELKNLFQAYVNSLDLKDDEGNPAVLEENGEGSFKELFQWIDGICR